MYVQKEAGLMRRGKWGKGLSRGRGGRGGRLLPALLILFMTAALFVLLENTLAPPLLAAAEDQARTRALTALTAAAGRQIEKNGADDYRQLVSVERDEQGRVSLLLPNTGLYNTLIHDVTLDAADSLDDLSRQRLSLPAGLATGSALLSGLGPDFRFRMRMLGTPSVHVEDELTAAGINQVRHRIWLELSAEVRVLAPFSRETTAVTATVLLAEGLIVGYVPETYVEITPSAGRR